MSGTVPPAVLVVGATGTVGRGVVAAALAAGHPLVAVARSRTRLRALRTAYPDADISLVPATIDTDEDAAWLARSVRRLRRPLLGCVVAIRADGARGRISDQPSERLVQTLTRELRPQLALARGVLPLLGDGQGYVVVGGPGDERPWAGYGHRSVASAALRMLARVLHDELRPRGVRVQLLAVESPVRPHAGAACACPEWPTADTVGSRALALLAAAPTAPAAALVRFAHVQRGDREPGDEATRRALRDARSLLRSISSGCAPPP